MKTRLLPLLLILVTILGILPTASLAAPNLDEALAEVDIYARDDAIDYLTMYGAVKNQEFIYYNYTSPVTGESREIPAYCVDPRLYGVPETVPEGTPIQYSATSTVTDPKICGIIANGYPHWSLEKLGLESVAEGYYATKTALWCYILSGSWSIEGLGINPALTGADREAAERVLEATKIIYTRGMEWDHLISPRLTAQPDRTSAYPVTIDGRDYLQQVFTILSETWPYEHVMLSLSGEVPEGTIIADMEDREIDRVEVAAPGPDGYSAQIKVLYPADSVEGLSGSVTVDMSTVVDQYMIYYAVSMEKDKYGNIQDYMLDTDPMLPLEASAVSSFSSSPEGEPDDPDSGRTRLRIVKLEAGTKTPLEGAVFSVTGPDGEPIGSYASNEDGEVIIPLTLSGLYTVTEEVPPRWHLLPEERTQQVTVRHGEAAELTFWNEPYGNLRVEKYSDTGEPLEGVSVQIKNLETGATQSGQTGPGGAIDFTELAPGGYEVRETAGIPGWQADTETVKTATVVSGETSTVTFTNKELPGLRIVKYDRESLRVLPGVTFRVWRDGELLGDYETDAQGEIVLPDCRPGTYRVEEVQGDDDHITVTTPQEIELKAGDGIRKLAFFNDKKPGLHLTKVDSDDLSKPIANAKFSFEAVDGSWGPVEYTTQEDGTIDLSRLPTGAVVVTELSCPGYVIDEAQRIIHLDPNEDAEFVFTNSKLPSLTLTKTSWDKSPLAGVSFRLTRIEDGGHYLDRTTGADGTITWEGLEPGVYSLVETATVSDHILDTREHHIQLFPGKDSTITLSNDRRPDLYIHKNDADSGAPIPGTVYLVKGADGHSIAEVETDKTGVAVVENLLPGVVEVIEKSVPEPYLLAEESQLVTLYPNRDRHVYFENEKRPTIEIVKENEITHDPLENVPVQVWYASNNTDTGEYNDLGVFYTDSEGHIVLSDPDLSLQDGWFRIEELEAPKGFSMTESSKQETFIAAGEGHTFRIFNRPNSAICVWKYDSETGVAIEGAVFQVRYLSGNTSGTGGTVIGTYRTSANGSFTVTGLEAGTYIIEELSSDGSHVIDTPPQTVYLSGEEQEVIQVYFGNSPMGSLLIKKASSSDNSPISDVQFFVTESDGSVVGDGNGYFTTDSAGTILIEGIEPGTTLVVKETRAKEGFLLDDTPQTAQITAGQTTTIEFRNQPKGNLIIHKLDSATKGPLEGVRFKITYADGSYLADENGHLSSNGLYWTDSEGQIVLSNVTGTLVVTEVQSIPGYTIDPNTQSQTVVVNPDDTQELWFYNAPVGGIEIIKVNASKTSERISDTTFEIRRMDDGLVDTITTDENGRAFLSLEDGSYYALEIEANPNFVLDETPHYFEVKDGEVTHLRLTNAAKSGILIHKVDTSGEGIYGVKFLLYDENRNPIGEFTSDDEGWVYITADDLPDGANTSGRFYLRELEAAEGYILDEEYKTVYVRPGRTAEIEWVNEAITGQIQIYKYAAEYNEVTGTPAGTPLQGAVYEISNARTGKVVDYITTDARGVAASKPLPLSRYKVVEVTAPAYWQIDPTVHDITLEYAGQIIKVSAYDKPSNLGVTITKRGNAEVLAGQTMRYDLTVANTSNVSLADFFWHDKIPYDVARATTLTTGTYSARLNYRILYKTNYQTTYQVLASNLLTTNNYSFALNAIPTQAGEVITDIYFDFGKVPVGFQSVAAPTLSVIINGDTVNGYQVVNRADTGGQYQGTWQTAQASWVTIVRQYTTTPDLPKTGY